VPKNEAERWRERLGLFKQQSQARFEAGMTLHDAVCGAADQLPESEEKARLLRAADEFLAAETRSNEAFWRDWEEHRAKWSADLEADMARKDRGGPTKS